MATKSKLPRIWRVRNPEPVERSFREINEPTTVTTENAMQIVRDLDSRPIDGKMAFSASGLENVNRMYGIEVHFANITPIISQAMVNSANEISYLHDKILAIESRTTQKRFMLQK